MKVLAIVSSPRKGGNGQLLAEHLLSGAEEAGAEIELLRLTELVIQPCLDCGFCKHPDHETCVQQDDMQNLYQKLAGADVLIFCLPIYGGLPNAPFLQFINRLYAMVHPDFTGRLTAAKKRVSIITLGGEGKERVDAVRAWMNGLFGTVFGWEETAVLWQNGLQKRGAIRQYPEKLAEAEQIGRKLAGPRS